jgi:prepilin-type N-terminal cleavage/methylation domain-containing protein
MLTKIRNQKEKGFSLLELAVAVGIAAIVAGVAVTASTVFVNGSQTKSEDYAASANSEIGNASARFDALWGEGGAPDNTPVVAAPGQVVDFYSTNTTATTADMVWTSPFTGGTVDQYLIIIGGETVATLAGNVNSYTVTGLTPSSTVAITIRAVNAGGNSEVTSNVFTPAAPAFDLTGYSYGPTSGAYSFRLGTMQSYLSYYNIAAPEYSSVWTSEYPVLRISDYTGNEFVSPQKVYVFVKTLDAAYTIDYYQNYLLVNNLAYYPEGYGPTPDLQNYYIRYDADPTAGSANRLTINWAGAAPNRPSGK